MKRFLKGVTVSFLMFFISFISLHHIILPSSNGWFGIIPILFLIIYTTCLLTEGIITVLEWKYYNKHFEVVILLVAVIISLPFFGTISIISSIYVGALGYYLGRKIPDHWTVYAASPIPLALAIVGLLAPTLP